MFSFEFWKRKTKTQISPKSKTKKFGIKKLDKIWSYFFKIIN